MSLNNDGNPRGPLPQTITVHVGSTRMRVSRDLTIAAGFTIVEENGELIGKPSGNTAFSDVVAALSLNMVDDEAFLWAISTSAQRRHERYVAETAKSTADTQLRTAQITLAIEREKGKEA